MAGKRKRYLEDNENDDQDVVFPVSEQAPEYVVRKGREIKYKRDRTGWVVMPLALLLVFLCAFSAIIALSDDPSGGIAGRAFDEFTAKIAAWNEKNNPFKGKTSTSPLNAANDRPTSGAIGTDNGGGTSSGATGTNNNVVSLGVVGTGSSGTSHAVEGTGSSVSESTDNGDLSSGEDGMGSGDSSSAVTQISTRAALIIQSIKTSSHNVLLAPVIPPSVKKGNIDKIVEQSMARASVSIKSLVKGTWEDKVYRNQFAGFILSLPEDWERGKEGDSYVISKEDVVGALAVNPQNGDNILIRFFDMSITAGANNVYEGEFLLGMQKTGEKDESLNARFGEIFSVKVGSRQYRGMMESVEDVVTMYYLARRIGDYMNIISIRTDGDFYEVMKMFSGI